MPLNTADCELIKTIVSGVQQPLATDVAEMRQQLTDLTEKLNEHHVTLYGNGKPGLAYEVPLLRNRAKRWDKLFWVGITAVLLAVMPSAINSVASWIHATPP